MKKVKTEIVHHSPIAPLRWPLRIKIEKTVNIIRYLIINIVNQSQAIVKENI
jgi:hypothetical protein